MSAQTDTQSWIDDGRQGSRDLAIQIVTWALVVLAAGVIGVTAIYPVLFAQIGPALLGLIGLAPWVLLLMVFLGDGRYLLFGPDWHTVNIGAIVLPVILGMGAISQFSMIDWRAPLVWALGMGMGFTTLGLMADASARSVRDVVVPANRKRQWMALPVTGVMLSWAMVIDVNGAVLPVVPGVANPAMQSVVIASKWISGGKSHTRYFTFVQAPVAGITNYEAGSAIYAHAQPGDRVCLVIHTGMLGWRWYDLRGSYACGDSTWGESATK